MNAGADAVLSSLKLTCNEPLPKYVNEVNSTGLIVRFGHESKTTHETAI